MNRKTANPLNNFPPFKILANLFKNDTVKLFFITLFAHGFILFLDGLYHDDYLMFSHLKDGKFNELLAWYRESGTISDIYAYIHLVIINIFGSNVLLGYRLISFAIIFLTGVLVMKLSQKLGFLDNTSSFWLAALSISYPMVKVTFFLGELQYILSLCVFLLAAFITFTKVFNNSTDKFFHGIHRILALLLFAFSFFTASLLVFYLGFLILLFVITKKHSKQFFQQLIYFIYGKSDYLILPIVYYFIKKTFFKAYGYYVGYNDLIRLSAQQINGLVHLFRYSILYSLKPLLNFINIPAFMTVIIIFFFCLYVYLSKKESLKGKEIKKNLLIFAFGCILLLSGIFPYIMVGRIPDNFVDSRHALLTAIPISIMVVSFLNILRRLNLLHVLVLNFLCLMLVASFSISYIKNYIQWQFRWIKDRSVISQLEELPQLKKYSTFYIHNNTVNPQENELYTYNFYEWSSLFKIAWGEEKWIGLEGKHQGEFEKSLFTKYYTSRFNLSDYKPENSKIAISIDYAQKEKRFDNMDSELTEVFRYYYYKFFQPKELKIFFDKLIKIQILKENYG